MSSSEIDLLLILTGDIYKEPGVTSYGNINWDRFFRLAGLNKVLYHVAARIVGKKDPDMPIEPEIRQRFITIIKSEEDRLTRLNRTIEVVKAVLGHEPYLLIKTYLDYPYIAEDVDLLARDPQKARALFERNGYRPRTWWEKNSFRIVEQELLDIEVYDRISPGNLHLVDDSMPWNGGREVSIAGMTVRVPCVEADIMTFMADMNFRTYEIALGELLYLYRLSSEADWKLMAAQAEKHNWLEPFNKTVFILNAIHHCLFNEPGPMEKYLPGSVRVKLDFPFITPFPHLIGALWLKGAKNLVKLPGYFSVRLKKNHPGLNRIYARLVLDYLGQPLGKCIYRK